MNSNSPGIEVLASTCWMWDKGVVPSRIVLCRREEDHPMNAGLGPDEFQYIVWMEINPEKGPCYFSNGDYSWDIVSAWDSFTIRSRRHLNVLHGCDYPVCLNEDQVVVRYAPRPVPDYAVAAKLSDKTYVAVAKVRGE